MLRQGQTAAIHFTSCAPARSNICQLLGTGSQWLACRQLRKAHSYAQVADRSHPLPVGGDESKEGSLNHTGQEFCAAESCNAQGTWRLVGDDWVLLSFMANFSWQKPTLQVPIERSSVVFDSNTYAAWLKLGDWQLCQR